MSGAGQPQAANCAPASFRLCPREAASFRPPSMLADALFEPWLRPARMDVCGGSAAAELATEAASVGGVQ
jgi:hypothetical protein